MLMLIMLSSMAVALVMITMALSLGLLSFSMILGASQALMALLSAMFGLMNVAGVATSLLFSFGTTSLNLGLHLGPISQGIYNNSSYALTALESSMGMNSIDTISELLSLFSNF